MLANFGTNSGGDTWWSNFELIQVEPHTIGQIWNQMQVEFYLAGEITQVIDSIPWVRCASGNVSLDVLSNVVGNCGMEHLIAPQEHFS